MYYLITIFLTITYSTKASASSKTMQTDLNGISALLSGVTSHLEPILDFDHSRISDETISCLNHEFQTIWDDNPTVSDSVKRDEPFTVLYHPAIAEFPESTYTRRVLWIATVTGSGDVVGTMPCPIVLD